VREANLALRFACELAMLMGVGWCGWEITPVLGFAFPLAFAVVWGLLLAPRAKRWLPDPWRFALELVLFALATAAFASVGQVIVAIVFAVAAVVTAALARIWPETPLR
jgi:hypothetical protein